MSLDGPSSIPPKRGKEGTSDDNPIVIPQLQPQPFRHFLLTIYGRYVIIEIYTIIILRWF